MSTLICVFQVHTLHRLSWRIRRAEVLRYFPRERASQQGTLNKSLPVEGDKTRISKVLVSIVVSEPRTHPPLPWS